MRDTIHVLNVGFNTKVGNMVFNHDQLEVFFFIVNG